MFITTSMAIAGVTSSGPRRSGAISQARKPLRCWPAGKAAAVVVRAMKLEVCG